MTFNEDGTMQLYIFWILHQTTTLPGIQFHCRGCISFESYIKPQLWLWWTFQILVVYLLNPTSNHNLRWYILHQQRVVYLLNPTSNHNLTTALLIPSRVVYLLNPTSNHNEEVGDVAADSLYIFWILHQTTTFVYLDAAIKRCISFESYIKPQLQFTNNVK